MHTELGLELLEPGKPDHEDGHHGEPHELDLDAADAVDEEDGEEVPWQGTADHDDGLRAGYLVGLLERAHLGCVSKPADAAEDVLHEEVELVEDDVDEEDDEDPFHQPHH